MFCSALIRRLLEFIAGNALQCSESLVSSVSSDNSQSDSQPTSADSAAVLQGPVKDGNTQGTSEYLLILYYSDFQLSVEKPEPK